MWQKTMKHQSSLFASIVRKTSRELHFCLASQKYHFRSRRPITKVVFSASLGKKTVYAPSALERCAPCKEQNKIVSNRTFVNCRLGWQIICHLMHSLLLFPRCVIYYLRRYSKFVDFKKICFRFSMYVRSRVCKLENCPFLWTSRVEISLSPPYNSRDPGEFSVIRLWMRNSLGSDQNPVCYPRIYITSNGH